MEINFDPERIKKLLDNMENSQLKKLEEGVGTTKTPISMVPFDSAEANGAGLAAAMADFKKDNINSPSDTNDLDLDKIEFDDVDFRSNFPKRKAELTKHQNTLDKRYKHDKQFGTGRLNEFETDPEEGPQPGDAEYHYPGPNKKQEELSKFNSIDWKVLHEWLASGDAYASDLTDSEDGMMSYEDLNLLAENNIVNVYKNKVAFDDDAYMNYDIFLQAAQNAWTKALSFIEKDQKERWDDIRNSNQMDEEVNTEEEKEFYFDTKTLYHFLQDAFDQLSIYNEAEAAKILETELLKHFDIKPKTVSEGSIERIKDANGVDITNKARVKFLATNAIGNVLHPGVNENGQQTIHVAWLNNPLVKNPPQAVLPTEVVVDDDTRIVREATSHSIPNGRSANGRPETFPGYFERNLSNKDLTNVGVPEIYLANRLTSTEFDIMANARNMNAQKEDPLMSIIPKPAVETIKYTMYETERLEEGYDFAADERSYHNNLNHQQDVAQYAGKEIYIKNPEAVKYLAKDSPKRAESIKIDLKAELEAGNVHNNKVIAIDYMDLKWLFSIEKVDVDSVWVKFEGAAI